jgi:hypothetical protein
MLALRFHGACIAIGLALGAKDLQSFILIHHLLPWLGYKHNALFCQPGKKNDTATKLF